MFIGEYQHNLDAKGRIVIPGKFREELHTTFILTRGLDGCLTIYSLKQWEKMFEEVNKLPTTKKAARLKASISSSMGNLWPRLHISKPREKQSDHQ